MSNWDLTAVSNDVKYNVLYRDGSIQAILYEGESFLGKATEIFAYLGAPQDSDEPVPGMVCVHGGGGSANRRWVEEWVKRGYAAISMDLGGHDAEKKRLANAGPDQSDKTKFSTAVTWRDSWTYHAVAAAMRANTILRHMPFVIKDRIGITGVSWGGYVTCITAGIDSRFACAISVYGCGFLQDNSADVWMKYFDEMTPAQKQTWHETCDPSVYLDQAKMPMFFVSGTNDGAYPLDSLEKSCALPADVTRCVRLEMTHGHDPAMQIQEIPFFANQHLLNRSPLPVIGHCVRDGDSVRSAYNSQLPVRKGYLLFTECHGRWQGRKWYKTPAAKTEKVVKHVIPKNATVCFLAIEDERGAYVSSSCLEL